MEDTNACIAEAIHDGKLRSKTETLLAGDPKNLSIEEEYLLLKAKRACSNIRNKCIKEGNNIYHRLTSAGIEASLDDDSETHIWPQFHQFHLSIRDKNPTEAVSVATQMGYRSKIPNHGAAWEVFRRSNSQLTLIKNDDATMRMILKWPSKRLLPRRFWPSVENARLIPLPTRLWPLTFIARPFHILLQKLGFKRKRTSMGFFLGTPHQLIPPLLKFAGLCKDDVLLDLGCGDGRVVVEAARLYGCKAIGYELDGKLCEIARDSATRSKVEHLIQIKHADAETGPVEASTVVFLFLPPTMVSRTLPNIIQRMSPGSKIIAHEQLRIKCDPQPDRSLPLIVHSALTVAHLWRVPS